MLQERDYLHGTDIAEHLTLILTDAVFFKRGKGIELVKEIFYCKLYSRRSLLPVMLSEKSDITFVRGFTD